MFAFSTDLATAPTAPPVWAETAASTVRVSASDPQLFIVASTVLVVSMTSLKLTLASVFLTQLITDFAEVSN